MAAHRKPRQSPLGGPAVRTAATLALASAATATLFEGSGHADPGLTTAQVKAKVDRLYHEAEVATEKYNGAKERADASRAAFDRLRDEAARRAERLNTARDGLGSMATAQYRSGGLDPAVQLALTSDPDEYLERAALAEKAADRQAVAVTAVRRELGALRQLRGESAGRLTALRGHEEELSRQKAAVLDKLAAARTLLARLTAEERARYDAAVAARDSARAPGGGGTATTRGTATAAEVTAGSAATRADRSSGGERGPVTAPNTRAAEAVSFARAQLGKPYVWGATGPSAYDCSGLTQAAWRAAGVSLPRTTYTQINAGQRVSRSQLAPGDLIFFYSGISHVGLYIGGGQMIHAPRPGAPVRVAPIDEMPFAGATRVG
ncbi:Putative NPL or P60 family secreted protein [Streptomyces venezuelae]|uniref:C40 family peptidase n=1 Tax=Streptomyces gardneri TaxID=66892 RepID=UPI0006BCC3F6|nr:C40 family peptidase [Streptomyces gardneri]ALO10512.1 Putative NPL or P60 family secreted protein [Streptomyces venezuelae]QPK47510.1 C40 family peptidase [Streptomyces gardneri]WRK38944.1 NlpC/P60 family protein [Streptomyces venezuelae]CUM39021.1 putative NLP/P60-family protein [Streptomyces venezuelae]